MRCGRAHSDGRRAAVGIAREQLIAVDEVEQGHRLAAQGMDEMV